MGYPVKSGFLHLPQRGSSLSRAVGMRLGDWQCGHTRIWDGSLISGQTKSGPAPSLVYHPGFADTGSGSGADAGTAADTGADTGSGAAVGVEKRALDAPQGSAHIPAPSGKEIPIFQ